MLTPHLMMGMAPERHKISHAPICLSSSSRTRTTRPLAHLAGQSKAHGYESGKSLKNVSTLCVGHSRSHATTDAVVQKEEWEKPDVDSAEWDRNEKRWIKTLLLLRAKWRTASSCGRAVICDSLLYSLSCTTNWCGLHVDLAPFPPMREAGPPRPRRRGASTPQV